MDVRIVLSVFIFFSCRQATEKQPSNIALPIANETVTEDYKPHPDTIPHLLKASLDKDSFVYEDLYVLFYSGNLFSDKEKHALVLYKRNDSKDMLKVYKFENNSWKEIFAYDSLKLFWVSTAVEFADMNFDGMKDIRIIRSVSNGAVMTAMHLFIYKKQDKILYVPEADEFCNLHTDENKMLVAANTMVWCKGEKSWTADYYKWRGNKLVHLKTVYPCKPDAD